MSDQSQPLLQAEGISREFKTAAETVRVLDAVDLSLGQGEMAALLGASGSGKSTLIQILGSLDTPSAGRVLLQGEDIFALNQAKRAALRNRKIAFIYQFHGLLPEFTALENVMMPLLIGRMAVAQATKIATEMLGEVGLSHRLTHKPGQMSGGERQRAAIARAVAPNPKLLLADEPTGNLDTHTAQGVFDLLKRLNVERKLSCLMVTHNTELADQLPRRLRLHEGRLSPAP
ncbi:ABC transporter ATP-binding protein [Magnetofaba australis]|uniref:ABC transporter ATP-binding protein n=1 Tax=Magnetofaba australis TaxID=1472297 RepID=UPI000A19D024|nr:ATP-binding cassette domain-containing protein [Magnetofaba australis]